MDFMNINQLIKVEVIPPVRIRITRYVSRILNEWKFVEYPGISLSSDTDEILDILSRKQR
jgi:hypothetical protein